MSKYLMNVTLTVEIKTYIEVDTVDLNSAFEVVYEGIDDNLSVNVESSQTSTYTIRDIKVVNAS